jgi:uncharacterized protein (TIGR03086 family)
MQEHDFIARAAAPTIAVAREITPELLDAPTPCAGWSVRDLIQHLLVYGPALEGAARKEPVPPADVTVGDDWRAAVEDQIDRYVAVGGEPAAWRGTASMGGPAPMPASMIGGMVLGELVVHGWDLARAAGRAVPQWDEEMLGFVLREVEKTGT